MNLKKACAAAIQRYAELRPKWQVPSKIFPGKWRIFRRQRYDRFSTTSATHRTTNSPRFTTTKTHQNLQNPCKTPHRSTLKFFSA
jgi:hypothetical protein